MHFLSLVVIAFGIETTSPLDRDSLPNAFCVIREQTHPSLLEHECVGTLLAPHRLLTASHCSTMRVLPRPKRAQDLSPYWYECTKDFRGVSRSAQLYEGQIFHSIDHFRFETPWFHRDASLLYLDREVLRAQPLRVALNEAEVSRLKRGGACAMVGRAHTNRFGDAVTVGWVDLVSPQQARAQMLMELEVDPAEVEQFHRSILFSSRKVTQMEKGDSGGALMCRDAQGQWVVIGINIGFFAGSDGKGVNVHSPVVGQPVLDTFLEYFQPGTPFVESHQSH